jgi:hypothetical protein
VYVFWQCEPDSGLEMFAFTLLTQEQNLCGLRGDAEGGASGFDAWRGLELSTQTSSQATVGS